MDSELFTKIFLTVNLILSIVVLAVSATDFMSYSQFTGRTVIYIIDINSAVLFVQLLLVIYPFLNILICLWMLKPHGE